MPNIKSIKYLFHRRPRRDWVDELFEQLALINPRDFEPQPETIKIPLDKPVQFRDGDEKQTTITLCLKDDNA